MRLLHSITYELKDFISDRPPYAILSHTWGDEEVTFQDMQCGLDEVKQKKGFKKLEGCCAQAQRDGYFWVWIDTCCIDKTSSSELSEAINSMYQWYKQSDVCYAYLADVPRLDTPSLLWDENGSSASLDDPGNRTLASSEYEQFVRSRWFQRGWTLQELIAPRRVEFYSSDWSEIGTKRSLTRVIQKTTNIPSAALCWKPPQDYDHSIRMSWAAERRTTREEDMAYCLLGLFEINMPLLYGEGPRAFYRLQEEIFRKSESFGLLVWSMMSPSEPQTAPPLTSVLASTPRSFRQVRVKGYEEAPGKRNLQYFLDAAPFQESCSYNYTVETLIGPCHRGWRFDPATITSRGIRITLKVLRMSPRREASPWYLAYTGFNGYAVGTNKAVADDHRLICIIIQRQSWGSECKRARPDFCVTVSREMYSKFKAKKLYLSTEPDSELAPVHSISSAETPNGAWRLRGVYLVVSGGCVEVAAAFPEWQLHQKSDTIFLSAPWTDIPPSLAKDQEHSAILCWFQSHQAKHPFLLFFGLSKFTAQAYCDIHQYSDHGVVGIQDKVESFQRPNLVRTDRVVRVFPEVGYSIRLAAKTANTKIFPGKKGDLVVTMGIIPIVPTEKEQVLQV